jgi:hypothetical protein
LQRIASAPYKAAVHVLLPVSPLLLFLLLLLLLVVFAS